jgi:hypothetical protein
MGRLSWRSIGCWTLCALPAAAAAQAPFSYGTPNAAPAASDVGGTPTIDLISLRASGPGVPLRNGNVVVGSERVLLDGKVLQRGLDYAVDYATGVVYIHRPQKIGQSLTVSYRYEKGKPLTPATQFAGINAFKFDVAPGALSMIMGFGMTERAADGTVVTSNMYGWNNSFSFGSSSLSGLFLMGDRKKVDASSLFEPQGPQAKIDEGSSQLLLQSLKTGFAGGTIEANYQDVSKSFTGFGSALAAGYNQATVDQLQKERGLKRLGFGFNNVNLGSLGFSSSFKSVQDGDAGVEWRSYGIKTGGLSLNWNSQKVDPDFKRFKDIAEVNRAQLEKELGLTRENLGGLFAFSSGKISFNTSTVEDLKGNGLIRRDLVLDTSKLKFNYADQEVDKTFSRVSSLMADEQAKYGREVGLKRQMMSLQASIFGGATQPLSFSQNIIQSDGGDYRAQAASVGGRGWSLEHSSTSVDRGFTGFSPLNATAEGDAQIKNIANMYGKDTPFRVDAERQWLVRGAGIERSLTRFIAAPFKGWSLSLDQLDLKGVEDGGQLQTMKLASSNFSLSFRKQNIGQQFSEISNMMEFERQRLGVLTGLDRTDFAMDLALKRGAKMAFSQMNADTEEGGASRQHFEYKDNKLQVEANNRNVDAGFGKVNQLIDPEKDLLNALKGFKERDVKVKWEILPNLKLEEMMLDSSSDSLDQTKKVRNTMLSWSPNKSLGFDYQRLENHSNDPMSVLFANVTERMLLVKNFGRMGTLKFLNESQDFDGTNTNLSDFTKQFLSYEAKIDAKTSLKTEQTRTRYDNGDKEDISANTISTELTKRAGVSVSDVKVDRKGDEHDETKRNYGFWYDLGNGMRVSYGYARHLNGETAGTMNSNLTITPGTVGGVTVGSANYLVNQWDENDRTQATSNIALTTAKPMKIGFLRDVKMNFGLDTAADYSKWVRENKVFGFSAKIGSNSIAYDYRGQMFTNNYRAIDRSFKLQTDQSDKRWLKASLFYKVRTLPWDEQVMIRDFNITAKPVKNVELTHQLLTNPEVAKGDAVLGTVPQAARSNKWRLDYKQSGNLTVGGSFEEMINDQNKGLSRTGGLNVMLFEKSGSPVKLFYGIEQVDGGGRPRRSTHRYSLQFDQRPGPNQSFSFFLGNVSYEHSIADGWKRNNWTARMDYQIRF